MKLPCCACPADFRRAPVDPDAAIGALLVQLPHQPVQRPLQEPQAVAAESGSREQVSGEALHPGREGFVIITVKRGMPANDGCCPGRAFGHQLTDASLLVVPQHRPLPVQQVAGEHLGDIVEEPSGRPGVLFVLEPQQLDFGADELTPSEVMGEAEQRCELRVPLATAALGQI